MPTLIGAVATLTAFLRGAFLVGGVVLGAVAAADWAVRTRRLNPFGSVARFLRARVDPQLVGIERRVLRAGGRPTATPLWASLTGIAVNIGLKIVLMGPLQQAGLALATSLGAWVNLGLLAMLASRRGFMHLDRRLYAMLACVALATVTTGLAMYAAATALVPFLAGLSHIGDIIGLAVVGIVGAAFYGATVYCAFGTAGMDLKSALRR